MINGFSSLFIAGFLIVALFRGNAAQLGEELQEDSGFIVWFMAIIVLLWISKQPYVGPIAKPLMITAFIAMALRIVTNDELVKQLTDDLAKLKG